MVDLVVLQSLSYVAAAIGVCVAAIYYAFTLRINMKNQELSLKTQELALKAQQQSLQTRQTQLFMGLYDKFASREYVKYFIDVAYGPSFKDYDMLKKEIDKRTYYWTSANILASFYEGIGTLLKENLIDIRFIALLMAGNTKRFWEKFAPFIDDIRRDYNFPRYMSETEYTYNRLMEYMEQHPEFKT